MDLLEKLFRLRKRSELLRSKMGGVLSVCKIPKALLWLGSLVTLLCASCVPVAEATPPPTPTLEITSAPSPTPTRHTWSGSGYSYTDETLGVRLEFPPEWEEQMTLVAGEWTYDKEKRACIQLMGSWDSEDPESCIGMIYFIQKTDQYAHYSFEDDDGWKVVLAETDEGWYKCYLNGMNRLRWSYVIDAPYDEERDNAYYGTGWHPCR